MAGPVDLPATGLAQSQAPSADAMGSPPISLAGIAKEARGQAWAYIAAGIAILLLLAIAVSYLSPAAAIGAANAAAVIGLVTATAVGIERLIEVLWTLVGLTAANSFWPLQDLSRAVQNKIAALDGELAGLAKQANIAMGALVAAGGRTAADVQEAQDKIAQVQAYIAQVVTVAASNPVAQVRKVTEEAASDLAYLQRKYPEIVAGVQNVNAAITDLAAFAAKFADNPGRQLTSIFIGAVLGLVVAWVLGLDMFTAILGKSYSPHWIPSLTVALTGIVMGLGSNPTHEVIRALQEYKNSQKDGTPG